MKKLAIVLSAAVGILAGTAHAAPPVTACTASNEGQIVTTSKKKGTVETYLCSDGWQLIRVCTNGVCVDH